MNVAIVIPFRDRGNDPLRPANLRCVIEHWDGCDMPVWLSDDGRVGDAQFNRSQAYNRGAWFVDADVVVFAEADMLVPYSQIRQAVAMAAAAPGLVVPFIQYRYLTPEDSCLVRAHDIKPGECIPESTMDNGESIGAINVVSRETLDAIGRWDEVFEGAWYDDVAMKIAFEVCAGLTRWVDGPAWHLWHKPGLGGSHLTAEDEAATARNKERLELYRQATTPERIRELTAGGH
jgi:hypothetical protein